MALQTRIKPGETRVLRNGTVIRNDGKFPAKLRITEPPITEVSVTTKGLPNDQERK